MKEELYSLIESADQRLIKMLYAVAKTYTSEEETDSVSRALEDQLNERLARYDAGEMTFSSWVEAKERIRRRSTDAT